MKAKIDGHKETKIGVSVLDGNKNTHLVEVGFDGEILFHGTDDYPNKPENRTEEEQRIISQVDARARYAAQMEFPDEDILPFEWNPDELERVVTAIQNHPQDAFERDFRAFYEAIPDPPVDRPAENVDLVTIGIEITEEDRIARVTDEPVMMVDTNTGDPTALGPDPAFEPHIIMGVPPLAIEMPMGPEFHEFVNVHAKCHVRDAYLHMGEQPPDEYMVQGYGKMHFFGMENYHDVRFPYDQG
ncbi:hypothetical protein [Halorubellus sp. PRR65]|uniref:hypothetical protein n=1 Tax=Halorubellus sp. PRR65 TaxID=3098148 RepID=UPI002B261D95|nr:hypothetical protein [Halorubellus sp. PRR65]